MGVLQTVWADAIWVCCRQLGTDEIWVFCRQFGRMPYGCVADSFGGCRMGVLQTVGDR